MTDFAYIDMHLQSYPSPLNYNHFPKSVCISANEVVCHGIPDQRVLLDGDIVNLDISIYHGGYHADLNETYYVGDKAKADPDKVRLVETTREALDLAIAIVKPGVPIREFGKVIEKHATSRNLVVVKTWGGHGINSEFHPPPWIPHYAKNKAVGTCKPGMTFTIEPILALGRDKEVHWPDNWTNVTVDGKWSAQFGEHRREACSFAASLANLKNCRAYVACHRDGRRGFDGKVRGFSRGPDFYSRIGQWRRKELIWVLFMTMSQYTLGAVVCVGIQQDTLKC